MKWWKIPPHDAPLADEGTIQAWRRKRDAIYLCVFAGIALATVGLLLKHTWAGRLLIVAACVPEIAVKFLNTACQTCPHCGHTSVPAQDIRHGFTCQRCGYTIPDE